MKISTFDDITGDGSKHQLITLLKIGGVAVTRARWDQKWWQAVMVTAAGTTRIGDANVSSTNGIPVGSNYLGQFSPPIAFMSETYDLSNVYVIIASNDVMSVAVAV